LKLYLFSLAPGKLVKWDATYSIGSRTLNDKESEDGINQLAILWGEFGHLMSWSFVSSEGSKVWQEMNCFLLKRCEMLDELEKTKPVYNPYAKRGSNDGGGKRKSSHVNAVVASYSDCCCEGCHDVYNQATNPLPNRKHRPEDHGIEGIFCAQAFRLMMFFCNTSGLCTTPALAYIPSHQSLIPEQNSPLQEREAWWYFQYDRGQVRPRL